MPSYSPEVIADSSGKFVGNNLRFATQDEAERYVNDLADRWMLVIATRVVPTQDPVNSRLNGRFREVVEPPTLADHIDAAEYRISDR